MVAEVEASHYDRKNPWTTIGTALDGPTSVDEILTAAGLDWEVETVVPIVEGKARPEFRAIRRTDIDEVFGFAKKGYQTVQNREAFTLVEGLLETEAVVVESAGPAKGGRRVWVQAAVNRHIEIDGDGLNAFLTVSTSHDGSSGVRASLGFLRLDCMNQMPALQAKAVSTWSHRHSTNVMAKTDDARRILFQAVEEIDHFEEEVRRLMDIDVTARRFDAIVAQLLPISDMQTPRQRGNVEEKREGVRAMYESDRDGGRYAGTGWGVVNAFNSYDQWMKPVKDESNRAERIIVRSLDGTFGSMTRRVAELVRS